MAIPTIAEYLLPDAVTLPVSRAPWQPDPARAVLLVHDMQVHFLRPYAPAHPALAQVTANIAMLAARCRRAGVPVCYTAQRGNQDPVERGLQRYIWGPGMADDGESPRIVEGLAPGQDDIVLVKHRYSALARTPLAAKMAESGRDQLIITGVYAQIGCLATALDAFMADIEPFMVSDAVAAFSRESHDAALRHVADYCGVVLSSAQLLEVL